MKKSKKKIPKAGEGKKEKRKPMVASVLGRYQDQIAALLITAACIVLFLCASGNFWLDEVLSFQWAKNAKSSVDILTLFRHDNNHPLNTLWIYMLGDGYAPWAYRALSIASGILSLFLTYRIALRITPSGPLIPLFLSAFSYPFILFFSEARGYGPALACTIFAFWILLRTARVPHPVWTPVFWVVCLAGILSHATIFFVIAAFGIWLLACAIADRISWKRSALQLVAWFLVPGLAAVAYYWYFLKPMMIAGGPKGSFSLIATEFFGYGFGLPASASSAWFTISASLILVASGLIWGRFSVPHIRILFVAVVGLFPMAAMALSGAEYLHFRYFLLSLPFLYFLLAGLAERFSEWNFPWKILGICVLAAYVIMQVPRIGSLIFTGRGQYVPALEHIFQSQEGGATVISNHDMLVGMVFEFYRRKSPQYSEIAYVPNWIERDRPSDWVIAFSQEWPVPTPEQMLELPEGSYRLENVFPSAPVSGAHWFLYRRINPSGS